MPPEATVLVPDVVHTGSATVSASVTVADGRIVAVGPAPPGVSVQRLPGLQLAPGLVDLQVNGGGGVQLNEDPTLDGVLRLTRAHLRRGTTSLLPTYITGPVSGLLAAVEAVRQARRHLGPDVVLGLHCEGPVISPHRAGVHPREHISDAFPMAVLDAATSASQGDPVPLLITVAPERLPPGTIAQWGAAGIRVAVGHSNATAEQCVAAFAEGATLATHLFNAMPPVTARAPGVVGASLMADDVSCAVIPDGRHVHPTLLRLVRRSKPAGQAFYVTDALAAAAGGPDSMDFAGQRVTVRDGACETAAGTLAGASIDMAEAVRRGAELLGTDLAESLRWASTYPAQWWGGHQGLGTLTPGAPAHLIALDDRAQVHGVMVRGTWIASPGT